MVYFIELELEDTFFASSKSFNEQFPTNFDDENGNPVNNRRHTHPSANQQNYENLNNNHQRTTVLPPIDSLKAPRKQHKDNSINAEIAQLLQNDHFDPITTKPPINENRKVIYDENNPLKINIVIPTSCTQKDANLYKMSRLSWINYFDKDNNLWNDIHNKCQFKLKYYVGNCDLNDSPIHYVDNRYIHKLENVDEHWNNLQLKTIEMIIAEYESDEFDLLFKTDTDSYVNIPNLCNYMVEIMNMNEWNATNDALYLGERRDDTEILFDEDNKYENKQWIKRTRSKKYIPFMAGFAYLLSYTSTEIIYHSLKNIRKHIAFNRLEDTYLGHYLSSFNVKYIDIGHVIDAYMQPTIKSLNTHIIDHMYNSDKNAVLMIDKYKMHCRVHDQYLRKSKEHKDLRDYTVYNPVFL